VSDLRGIDALLSDARGKVSEIKLLVEEASSIIYNAEELKDTAEAWSKLVSAKQLLTELDDRG